MMQERNHMPDTRKKENYDTRKKAHVRYKKETTCMIVIRK